jgi:hypothetical protein
MHSLIFLQDYIFIKICFLSQLITSNGAIVTGYAVFADGRKILEIDSPSGK